MLIRKLTKDDLEGFREIREEMCREHPEAFGQTPEEVRNMAADKLLEWLLVSDTFPEKFVLGAFDDDRLLGTAAFRREDTAKERHRGWVWSVYVRPEGRGQSLARQLMDKIIEESRKMEGLEMLTLTVALSQTNARTLYTSLGFFTCGLNLHGYKLPDGRYVDLEDMTLWV